MGFKVADILRSAAFFQITGACRRDQGMGEKSFSLCGAFIVHPGPDGQVKLFFKQVYPAVGKGYVYADIRIVQQKFGDNGAQEIFTKSPGNGKTDMTLGIGGFIDKFGPRLLPGHV